MNKIILASGTTQNYYKNVFPYLISINLNSNFDDNLLITLGFNCDEVKNIKNIYLDPDKFINKTEINCLQHGEFIKADYFNGLSDNDIIIFTDGDILLQRNLTAEEEKEIRNLKNGQIMVQYNAGYKDNLLDEYYRISPSVSHENFEKKFNLNLKNMPCYNTGVIVCNLYTWKILEKNYSAAFPAMKEYFKHYAKQQWILCVIINNLLQVKILDNNFHCHYHHGRISESYYKDDLLYFKDSLVMFCHNTMDNDLPINKNGFALQQQRTIKKLLNTQK